MAIESSRDARRRKILDRGTDRLAFITGQARSLPPFPVDAALSTAPPPYNQEAREVELEEAMPAIPEPAPDSDRIAIDHELPKFDVVNAAVRDKEGTSSSLETSMEQKKRNVDTVQGHGGRKEPVTSDDSHDEASHIESRHGERRVHEIFTTKRIISSVSACENSRMLCAVLIGLLVVLSHNGYPIVGKFMGSIMGFRPVYLVLLTDATLVLGMLVTTRWEEETVDASAGRRGQESKDCTEQVGQALELVLALRKVAGAVFWDCCLCAIIIVCGACVSIFIIRHEAVALGNRHRILLGSSK